MNKIVASISLGTAVCITASAFAQDSHLSLTRQSVASMHEIAAALDKVTDEPGAAAAVETVKKFIKAAGHWEKTVGASWCHASGAGSGFRPDDGSTENFR